MHLLRLRLLMTLRLSLLSGASCCAAYEAKLSKRYPVVCSFSLMFLLYLGASNTMVRGIKTISSI